MTYIVPPGPKPEDSLSKVYLSELRWHCMNIADRRRMVDQLLCSKSATRFRLGDEYLLVEPAILTALMEIVLSAANIKKLINPDKERRGMTKAAHDYLLERARKMSNAVAGLPISEIHNAKTRNALEHFDRELDQRIRRAAREGNASHKIAVLNVTLSSRRALSGIQHPGGYFKPDELLLLRAYIADTTTFVALDEEIDIGKLCSEAELIEERIKQLSWGDPQAGQLFLL